jgi:SH3 domain
VRVGIEKEHGLSPDSKMVVLHDFTPCVDDELEVKRGQIVNILYRENDWVYIIGQDTRQEGFIPHSYCAPYNTHLGLFALQAFAL